MPWPKDPLPSLDHLALPPHERNACLAQSLCSQKNSHPLNFSAIECTSGREVGRIGKAYGIWGDGPCGAKPQWPSRSHSSPCKPRKSGKRRGHQAIFPTLLLNVLKAVYGTGEHQHHRAWYCSKAHDGDYTKCESNGCTGFVLASRHQVRWNCSLPAPKSNFQMVAFYRIGGLSRSDLEKEMDGTDIH